MLEQEDAFFDDAQRIPQALINRLADLGQQAVDRDISKRKQAEAEKSDLFKELAQQGDLLRNLNAKLAAVQESERKELARELHDRVGQNLTALGAPPLFIAACKR